jgi:peptidoglycan hydrolase-like protein with peptidoglycan-binding domain
VKKIILVVLVFASGLYMFGCGKKQQSLEDMQQPMSMETLATMSTTATNSAELKVPEVNKDAQAVLGPVSSQTGKLDPLPPSGPYKPTAIEIQTALKNAGFYSGAVDGKVGPNTKKAITEFQKSQGLSADGKVGPKTWGALGKFLNIVVKEAPRAR